ncbi:hypothetical protein [Halorarum halobium]|uniref:hypothetical protein n=1 Tax=Halorarum halobium TaxID=3075121 RepID=UPI0028AD6E93|nr:hypothetical protein [Halobaculum sp. XH14]
MSVVRRIGLTPEREWTLVRLLQLCMLGIFLLGLVNRDPGIMVNAGAGLLVSLLPAALERNYGFTVDVGLVLWIAVAMFLHAFGTVPLPGLDFSTLYGGTWWWDHLTHALSASLVVGVAYTGARALDEHSEAIALPPRFLALYLLVFVLAFGVVWELLEFYISVASGVIGGEAVLTQYGLEDTVLDIVYDSVGGLVVAVVGTAHLTGVVDQLAARLDERAANR